MRCNLMSRRTLLFSTVMGLAALPFAGSWQAAWAQVSTEEAAAEIVLGKADAPITMYMYESLVCHHCADFHAETLPKIKEQYVDKGLLKIAFRQFPGTRENPYPAVPAMMARCLGTEKYFRVVDMLYRDQEKWTKAQTGRQFLDNVFAYGRLAGMSRPQFDACLKNGTVLQAMADRWKEGVSSGLEGTPFFVIGERKLAGNKPLADFEAILKPLIENLPRKN